MRAAILMALVLVAVSVTHRQAMADGIKFVVPIPNGPPDYPLWTDALAANTCARATIGGRPQDIRAFCQDGVVPGVKPVIGRVPYGVEVELLEGRGCGDMVHVRVLTGEHHGAVGCITGRALSSRRPDGGAPTTGARPAPDWCKADHLVWRGDSCVEKK
jgi:hypothetical protein